MGLTPRQVLTQVELRSRCRRHRRNRIAVVSTATIATIAALIGDRGSAIHLPRAAGPTPFKTEIHSAGFW